jgi:hypothetical protein
MRQEVRDAIQAARTADAPEGAVRDANPIRRIKFEKLRNYLHQVVRELPPEMTMQELVDELDNASNQGDGD